MENVTEEKAARRAKKKDAAALAEYRVVPLTALRENPKNPRKTFDGIDELSGSIKQIGPGLARPHPDGAGRVRVRRPASTVPRSLTHLRGQTTSRYWRSISVAISGPFQYGSIHRGRWSVHVADGRRQWPRTMNREKTAPRSSRRSASRSARKREIEILPGSRNADAAE